MMGKKPDSRGERPDNEDVKEDGTYSIISEKRKAQFPETKPMLDIPTLDRIIDIMVLKFPSGSDESEEILGSYYAGGEEEASVRVIELILHAIEDELQSLKFKDIGDNEGAIVPLYAKKLGLDIEQLREKFRKV